MILRTIVLVAMLVCAAIIAQANAAEPPSTGWLTKEEHPDVSVRLAFTGQVDRGRALATLEVNLNNDWKTYWRAPGEGGIAPTFKQSQGINTDAIEWLWPVPERYSLQGLTTVGYQDSVVFPLAIPIGDTQPFDWHGVFTLSSCTNVCVLTDYAFELSGQPGSWSVVDGRAQRYQRARSQVPVPSTNVLDAVWDHEQQRLQLTAEHSIEQVFFFSPDPNLNELTFSDMQVDGQQAIASVSHWLETPDLSGKALRAVVISDNGVQEAPLNIVAGSVQDPGNDAVDSLVVIFLFALLGGFILNLMPCVLPVLGMKLRSLLQTDENVNVRAKFLATSAGIVSTFFVLGLTVALMKWSGQSVGWGMQFQNPWFLAALALITALFTANLLGLFEFRLPQRLSQHLASTTTGNHYRGDFFQGIIATVLATPCTAPFLGTAVAFAMGSGVVTQLAVFVALGIGMSLPWLLIAARPSFIRYLPKPGRWLNAIKPFFGILMGLTTLWLLSLLVVHHLAPATATPDPGWNTFQQPAIAKQVARGKVVFVDVTADWCLTCKANKRAVIEQNPVAQRLSETDVHLLQADWTTPSDHITDYLHQHNRYGVPFNIVYGPSAPEGIPLPVILTDNAVLKAIEQAQ